MSDYPALLDGHQTGLSIRARGQGIGEISDVAVIAKGFRDDLPYLSSIGRLQPHLERHPSSESAAWPGGTEFEAL